MAEILVVEDDRAIADLIALYLRQDGHNVVIAADGRNGLALLQAEPLPYDLAILDLMLPGLDGRGIIRRLREYSGLPVMMVTALDDDRDVIEGFDYGADDYLTKPFNPNELVARVRAILRRTSSMAPATLSSGPADIHLGNTVVDPNGHLLFIDGVAVDLRPREFDLLHALATNAGAALSRESLYSRVWGGEYSGDTRTVDVHISRLRERLLAAGSTIDIRTVRGIGYRLNPT